MFNNRPPQTTSLGPCIAPRRTRLLMAMIVAASALASLPAFAQAPYLRAAQPITDSQGRTQVIVDFAEKARETSSESLHPTSKYSGTPFARFHNAQALSLIEGYESRYKFVAVGMTTWVGDSLTTHLTRAQIEALLRDPLVKQISDDRYEALSAPPPWADSVAGTGDTISWGRTAVNGKDIILGSTRLVYVIDTGVAQHADLSNVVARTNVACGAGGGCELSNPATYPVVGCYAHSTHVAGIIGAENSNGQTTAGVYAGVGIVSVSVLSDTNGTGICGNSAIATSSVGYALDYVYAQAVSNINGPVAIVNISINGGQMGWSYNQEGNLATEPNYGKVSKLARPAILKGGEHYKGTFVVQSAGNFFDDVCTLRSYPNTSRAYMPYPANYPFNSADALDGIMVVGAVKATGVAVSTSEPFSATIPANLTGLPGPSNYGRCVDIWAPGDAIVSTWGNHSSPNTVVGTSYSGNPSSGSSGWAFLSGTSMAAPHVAAAAAYLADAYGLTDSIAIETKVRSFGVQFNMNVDNAGQPVNMIQLP